MNFAYESMKRLFGLFVLLACVASGSACRAAFNMSLSPATVPFGTVTQADLDTGFMELTASDTTYALTITVSGSGASWTLKTKASTSNFTAAVGVKPCSDLQWRLNGLGSYTAYTISDVTAATGTSAGSVYFDFKMLTSWSNTPDTYNINVVFTISSP